MVHAINHFLHLPTEFTLGGMSAIFAGVFTNPLEVIKIRLQLQGELQKKGFYIVHYRGFFHAFITIAKTDGLRALQKGLVPAVWYQLCLNGVRLGMVQYAMTQRWTLGEKGRVSIWRSALVGAAAGSAGALIGSPFYLVKTHLQSQAAACIAVGHQHNHRGMILALQTIYERHGILGLWRGCAIAMPLAALASATQLITFATCKQCLLEYEVFEESPSLNIFVSSMFGGLAITAILAPFDVVMTRLYNQGVDAKGRGLLYAGALDCIGKMWHCEGVNGFFKGFWPTFVRLGPHTILLSIFYHELKTMHKERQARRRKLDAYIAKYGC